MDTIDLRKEIDVLRQEGFKEAYVVDDPPGKIYPPHEHYFGRQNRSPTARQSQ